MRLINKAKQSSCRYKVSAVAYDRKGRVLGYSINAPWTLRRGKHAEEVLISRYRGRIKTIVIARVNNGGDLLPINPCDTCLKKASKYNITIKGVQ